MMFVTFVYDVGTVSGYVPPPQKIEAFKARLYHSSHLMSSNL